MSDSEIQMNVVHLTKINKINHLGLSKMKINHIISESEIEEAIPFTKQWKKERQTGKDIKSDIKAMASDLKVWMRGSGLKNVTVDQFKDFLNQKGLPSNAVDTLDTDRAASGVPDGSPMTSSEVNQYLEKAVRSAFQAQGAGSSKSRYAQQAPAQGQGGGQSGASGLPPSLSNAINNLTPQQKAALKALL